MTTQHDERAELIAKLKSIAAQQARCPYPIFGSVEVMRQAAALLAADSRAGGEVVKRGFVQVPFRMNQAMRDVTDSEGWTWEDLLGAAEAITEEQYDELAADPEPADSKAGGEVVYLVATGQTYEGQELYTRHDVCPPLCEAEKLYTHPAPAEREPLTEVEARNLCRCGPVYAPDGVVTRRPNEYRREIEKAMVLGLRKGEAAHGIGKERS